MFKLFQEYKASLKDLSEFFDLYLFRPFAFILVKLIYRFPVTPNQLSLLSIVAGIMSGIFYSRGDAAGFLNGGLLYGLTRVVDCSDGMLARLKKNGTPTGRIIDGIADYINGIVVYTGLGIGLSKAGFEFPVSPWLLVIAAAGCMALHCLRVDYYRSEFMAHALGKENSALEDKELFSAKLQEIKQVKGKYIDKFLMKLYLRYSDIQGVKISEKRKYDRDTYYTANKLLIRAWSLIGSSTYIFMLMITSIFYKPVIFFCYSLVVANIWILLVWTIQIKTNKKIAMKVNV